MPNGETEFVTRGRLQIPGDSEAIRISDVWTDEGPRGLVEIVQRDGHGRSPLVLASATFDREQVRHIAAAFALLWQNFMKIDDKETPNAH